MKPYAEYKKTGLDWLPRVPKHWGIRKIQTFARVKSVRNKSEAQLLSVYRDYGVIPKDSRDDNHNVASEDLSNYKFVEVGDLVLNKMKTWQGSLAISSYEGIVSPAYIVCSISGDWNRDYLHLLLRTPMYIGVYNAISYGVRIGQWDMRWEDFKQIPVVVPPLEEQKRIVSYLGAKKWEIESYIAAKRALLLHLKELSAAVISRAVTRGLNPVAETKLSGVEWLGEVPKHWDVKRLKFVANEVNLQTMVQSQEEIYVGLENIESGTGKYIPPLERVPFESAVKRFRKGDVLFGRLRPYLAKVLLANCDGVCVGECLVFRPHAIASTFFHYLLLSTPVIALINSSTYGAKMPRANWDFIGCIKIPLPPIEEQHAIVAFIESQLATIREAQSRIEREIELARELWTTLVAAVVTGQVDVSDWSGTEEIAESNEEILETGDEILEFEDEIVELE